MKNKKIILIILKILKILKKIFGLNFIITLIYLFFILIIIFIISSLIPQLIQDLQSFKKTIGGATNINNQLNTFIIDLNTFIIDLNTKYNINLSEYLQKFYNTIDISNIIDNIINNIVLYIKGAGIISINIILSLLLSYIFILDRKNLQQYLSGIKNSYYGFLYKEYENIFYKILDSFGLILKARSLIAFLNATFTIIGLLIVGFFFHNAIGSYIFPYLLVFWLLVFITSFIPVFGVFISGIPILLIAYLTIGGWLINIIIILLILIVHSIETYYLNPKIISNFIKTPISLTFIILIISEQLFGIIGLVIGVSLFYFILGLFKDFNKFLKNNVN